MSRSERARMGQETVEIVKRGAYTTPAGRVVSIAAHVAACVAGTKYLTAEETEALRLRGPQREALPDRAVIEIRNESTIAAILRLGGVSNVGVLNFASARNPGGGFLGGSQAQEESLARSSALYESLLAAPEYYERHRQQSSLLYSDAMIVSPDCPVLRDDSGLLLDEPLKVRFITAAAPNAGAVAQNQPENQRSIQSTLRRRSEQVLAVAADGACRTLVLGAWGCGVFRNDPAEVAEAFATHLGADGRWAHQFERVVFAILDSSLEQRTVRTFELAFSAVTS